MLECEGYSQIVPVSVTPEDLFFAAVYNAVPVLLRVERFAENMGPDAYEQEYHHNVWQQSAVDEWVWFTAIAAPVVEA